VWSLGDRRPAEPILSGRGPPGDGILLTPSHNPPEDGGLKQDPTTGGTTETGVTRDIQYEADRLLEGGLADCRRGSSDEAAAKPPRPPARLRACLRRGPGERARHGRHPGAGVSLGVDPLGGASAPWGPIAERYDFDLAVTQQQLGEAVTAAHQITADLLSGAGEIAGRLGARGGNRDRVSAPAIS